jgi:hypothetical protein
MPARKPPGPPPPPWWSGLERFLLPEEKRQFGIPEKTDGPPVAQEISTMDAQLYKSIDALHSLVALTSDPDNVPDRNVRSALKASIAIVRSAVEASDGINKVKAKRALREMAGHVPHICDRELAWDSRMIEIEALADDLSMFLEHVPAYAAARGIEVRTPE